MINIIIVLSKHSFIRHYTKTINYCQKYLPYQYCIIIHNKSTNIVIFLIQYKNIFVFHK